MKKDAIHLVPELITQLYTIVDELESLFPSKKFTPDGHLVGSMGEVYAAYRYGLVLLNGSTKTHDAIAKDGKQVQIKVSQRKTVGLRELPEHLIVLKLNKDGSFVEIYNGSGELAWNAAGKLQVNGQRSISFSKLEEIMRGITKVQKLPVINS